MQSEISRGAEQRGGAFEEHGVADLVGLARGGFMVTTVPRGN
jgi:hypothetical protein